MHMESRYVAGRQIALTKDYSNFIPRDVASDSKLAVAMRFGRLRLSDENSIRRLPDPQAIQRSKSLQET